MTGPGAVDEKPTCEVCGQGGYWIGFVPLIGEFRCPNHLSDDPEAAANLAQMFPPDFPRDGHGKP